MGGNKPLFEIQLFRKQWFRQQPKQCSSWEMKARGIDEKEGNRYMMEGISIAAGKLT